MMDPVRGLGRARINVQATVHAVVTAEASAGTAAPTADAKLRKAVDDLQGLFVQQLFKAMRDTVPQNEGIVSGGSGEDLFTSLMDQHVAAETPTRWEGGIGDALYRQLRGVHAVNPAVAPSTQSVSTVPSAH